MNDFIQGSEKQKVRYVSSGTVEVYLLILIDFSYRLSTRETSNVVENLKRQYGLRKLVEELKLAGIIDSFNEDKI